MSIAESRSDDVKYFSVLGETFAAPVFFYLSLVMFALTVYCVMHAAHQPKDLVLGCLAFVLGYNACRAGKKLKGE